MPPGTPLPISPDAPREKTTNVKKGKKQEAANKKEEEAKRALAELRDRCADSLKPFVDKDLSEEEWHGFCELVQKLPEELKEITSKFGQRRGDPTRNWRRRQQRKPRRRGVTTISTKLVAMKRRVRVMTNLKETGERITTITITKEGRMTMEEEMIGERMTGDLGRTTNAEEMTTAEEGMTEGLGRTIERIGETGTATKRLHIE